MFHLQAALLLTLIFGLPLLGLVSLSAHLSDAGLLRAAFLLSCPILYAIAFVLVAGIASIPFHRSIVPGSFPRDLRMTAYRNRRYYGLCWTSVFYFTPIYWLCLTVPPLKWLLFRLFGYRGQMNFTVYPDTWIRDLPLLDFGECAYVANKSTLGTNVCLNDGTILVDKISLASGTMVGHMTMIAPGVVMERGSEVGVGAALGMRVHLEPDVSVGGCCDIGHLTRMEAGSSTGTSVDIGAGSRIGPRIHVPSGTFVPSRSRWKTALDMRTASRRPEPRSAHPTPAEDSLESNVTSVPELAGERRSSVENGTRESIPAEGSTGEFRSHWNAFE